VAQATLPGARSVVATLGTIAQRAAAAGLEPPATLVVGDVVRLARGEDSRAATPGAGERPERDVRTFVR
jgi:uroporphyrin-III C-methyltransferase/precorrin-2 dehydrogenase/sirohydrochlorin ferrochelatase